MVRNAPNRPRSLSLFRLLVACAVLAIPSHGLLASTPNVRELQTKAEKGFVNQQIALAEAYFTGNGVRQDAKLAAYWYQKAAESGNPEAQNLVGYFYEVGLGVNADEARALHWFQLSAASGLPDATLNLGVLYVFGLGVNKDGAMAAQYFEQAVQRGNGTGASYLGTLYYTGMGVRQDRAAGERWYAVGRKMHDPVSAYALGTLYSTDPDHPHDLALAAQLLRQSAAAKFAPGMHSLALLLVHHPELAKSPQEAPELLEAAAAAGYWKSSLLLGILARDGNGVPADSKAAYYHFRIAALQGGAPTQALVGDDLHKLAARLAPEQTEALDSDANLWVQQHRIGHAFVQVNGNKKSFFSDPAPLDPVDALHASLPLSDPSS